MQKYDITDATSDILILYFLSLLLVAVIQRFMIICLLFSFLIFQVVIRIFCIFSGVIISSHFMLFFFENFAVCFNGVNLSTLICSKRFV